MLFPLRARQLFARERCAAAGGTGEGKVHHYAFQVERQTLRAIAAGGFLQRLIWVGHVTEKQFFPCIPLRVFDFRPKFNVYELSPGSG